MNPTIKPHACKLCDLPGHNVATCPDNEAAIGRVIMIGTANAKPNNYLKITRWIADGERRAPVSAFVLFVSTDEAAKLAAYREARRVLRVPGWEKATIAALEPLDFPGDVEIVGRERVVIREEVGA